MAAGSACRGEAASTKSAVGALKHQARGSRRWRAVAGKRAGAWRAGAACMVEAVSSAGAADPARQTEGSHHCCAMAGGA